MFLRILKRDLKRKKTMNYILLLFIVLATMFVASGLNNVLTVANGTDYYLEKAGVGDYIVITMGDNVRGKIHEVLKEENRVKSYRVEPVIVGSKDNILFEDGKIMESKNATLFQSIDSSVIHFFNCENQEITSVSEGYVYVSGSFMEKNDLQEGDRIRIEHSGVAMSLILAGKAKDALLGSEFMGNTRVIMNEKDMQKFLANEEIALHYQGEIAYIDSDDIKGMGSVISNIPNVNFSGSRSMIEMCYVMDMIVAFVILILSLCLMLVSFVVLKFSITFTISEEFREIGVMKAIGITNRKIRSLYIIKYLLLSVIGAIVGFFGSIPFGRMLIRSVSENMVLGNEWGFTMNIAGTLLVVIVILLFAYHCTGKVKKSSPVDAIRNGQTGERYRKKTIYRIGKSHVSPNLYLALNDVISSPKRFLTIVVSFFLCMLFVLTMVNTTETMKSENLIETFGTRADLYITDVEQAMQDMGSRKRENLESSLGKKAEELTSLGMPSEFSVEVQYKYKVFFEGTEYLLCCQQGMNCKVDEYKYTKGVVPQNANEIAITPRISEMTGAKIGDVLTIDFGEEKLECMVTAYFESMNQLGEVIRLHESAPTAMDYCCNIMQYKINFTDNPSKEEIEIRKERIKDLYHNEDIMNATEYCIDCVAVADTMVAVQYMLLGITLVVVMLVTILMERAFIADEKSQIAILKAIGFQNKDIIKWHTYRFVITAFIAVLLAAVVSIPVTDFCISPIFGMMGASDISYNIVYWKVFGVYPGIVLAVTLFVAWVTAQYTRTIKSRDTADIE